MAQEEPTKQKGEFDIFIRNRTYPDAESVFTALLQPIEGLKDDCIVVLDTNALIVPYQAGARSLEEIEKTYKSLVKENRLVIPGQVAREFADLRAKKIAELFQQIGDRKSKHGEKGSSKHPLLEQLSAYRDVMHLEEEYRTWQKKYGKAMDKVAEQVKSWTWNDPVSIMYRDVFGKDVVYDMPLDEGKIQQELARRWTHKIPPGYKDGAKPDEGVGDLLIWFTICEIGKTHQRHVLFVSGEEKSDWCVRSNNQILYPRYELVDEFRRCSGGKSFHIVEFSRFLDLYGASEEVVAEIRQEERRGTGETGYRQVVVSWEHIRQGMAEQAVYYWLRQNYPMVQVNPFRFPDFVACDGQVRTGYQVKTLHHPPALSLALKDSWALGRRYIESGESDRFCLIIVTLPEQIAEVASRIHQLPSGIPQDVSIIVGTVESNLGGEGSSPFRFIPYEEFP